MVVAFDDALTRLKDRLLSVVRAEVESLIADLDIRVSSKGRMRCWIISDEPLEGNLETLRRQIVKAMRPVLTNYSLSMDPDGVVLPNDWVPNPPEGLLLWGVKAYGPISPSALSNWLAAHSRHFSGTSERQIRRCLDGLQKQRLILHVGAGEFVVTAQGLARIVGTPSRQSSDVHRALHLGRRRW